MVKEIKYPRTLANRMEKFLSFNYPTPEDFRDKHAGSNILIISSGTSTKDLIKYRDKLRDHFDVIIGVNRTCLDFEDALDYHMVMEKNPTSIVKAVFQQREYRRDLTRVLNSDIIEFFPKDLPVVKVFRFCEKKLDITNSTYRMGDKKVVGLQDCQTSPKAGIPNTAGFGTVTLQALHFACIIGGTNIHLIGADLMFKGEYDHYYKDDDIYRSPEKHGMKHTFYNNMVKVNYHGKEIETTFVFRQSAGYLDKIIKECCIPAGIKVYDFSDGILTVPTKLDLDEFFKTKPHGL